MKLFSSKLFIWALVLLVLCSVIIGFSIGTGKLSPLTNGASVVITPIQHALTTVSDFFNDLFGYFYRYNSLQEENAELKSRVLELERKEREYQAAIYENEYLRELAGLKRRHADYDCELAEVIGISSDGISTTFTLSRGTKDGVEVNDAVITGDGLVGYVSRVEYNSCQVKPITDVSVKMGAVVSRTREVVVAEGSFELADDGLLRLSYLQNDSDVLVGDTVETSGYGGIFPKGLLIGTITEVLPESHGISTYAKIQPAVDLTALKKVYIVKSFTITE